jgi:hypothetical protein
MESLIKTVPELPVPITGIEGYTLRPNRMILVQSQHEIADVPLGAFHDKKANRTWYDENAKTGRIKIIPLEVAESRVCWPPNAEFGDDPLCKSTNGIVPITGDRAKELRLVPQSNFCKQRNPETNKWFYTCEHASWAKYRDEGKVPDCVQQFTLIFLDKEDLLPYMISFHKMSLAPFKDFMDSLGRYITSAKNRNGQNLYLFDFVVEITSQKMPGKKGSSFYVPKFGTPTYAAEFGMYREYYDEYVFGKNNQPGTAEVIEGDTGDAPF